MMNYMFDFSSIKKNIKKLDTKSKIYKKINENIKMKNWFDKSSLNRKYCDYLLARDFGKIYFPYIKMGKRSSGDLFTIDKMIIFLMKKYAIIS